MYLTSLLGLYGSKKHASTAVLPVGAVTMCSGRHIVMFINTLLGIDRITLGGAVCLYSVCLFFCRIYRNQICTRLPQGDSPLYTISGKSYNPRSHMSSAVHREGYTTLYKMLHSNSHVPDILVLLCK